MCNVHSSCCRLWCFVLTIFSCLCFMRKENVYVYSRVAYCENMLIDLIIIMRIMKMIFFRVKVLVAYNKNNFSLNLCNMIRKYRRNNPTKDLEVDVAT